MDGRGNSVDTTDDWIEAVATSEYGDSISVRTGVIAQPDHGAVIRISPTEDSIDIDEVETIVAVTQKDGRIVERTVDFSGHDDNTLQIEVLDALYVEGIYDIHVEAIVDGSTWTMTAQVSFRPPYRFMLPLFDPRDYAGDMEAMTHRPGFIAWDLCVSGCDGEPENNESSGVPIYAPFSYQLLFFNTDGFSTIDHQDFGHSTNWPPTHEGQLVLRSVYTGYVLQIGHIVPGPGIVEYLNLHDPGLLNRRRGGQGYREDLPFTEISGREVLAFIAPRNSYPMPAHTHLEMQNPYWTDGEFDSATWDLSYGLSRMDPLGEVNVPNLEITDYLFQGWDGNGEPFSLE